MITFNLYYTGETWSFHCLLFHNNKPNAIDSYTIHLRTNAGTLSWVFSLLSVINLLYMRSSEQKLQYTISKFS